MHVLLDTNVLVAALVTTHIHHHDAIRWFQQAEKNKVSLMLAVHSLAETYAVLTRLPVSPRISPILAQQMLKQAIPAFDKIQTLSSKDYLDLVLELSLKDLSGGIIYDAIILKTAKISGADKLVTFNRKHFVQLCDDLDFIISH